MKANTLNSAEFVEKLRHADVQEFLAFVRDSLEKSNNRPEINQKMDDLFKLDQQIFWDDKKDKTIMRVVNMLPLDSFKQALIKIVNYYHSQMLGGIMYYCDLFLQENDLRLKAEAELKIYKTAIEKLL